MIDVIESLSAMGNTMAASLLNNVVNRVPTVTASDNDNSEPITAKQALSNYFTKHFVPTKTSYNCILTVYHELYSDSDIKSMVSDAIQAGISGMLVDNIKIVRTVTNDKTVYHLTINLVYEVSVLQTIWWKQTSICAQLWPLIKLHFKEHNNVVEFVTVPLSLEEFAYLETPTNQLYVSYLKSSFIEYGFTLHDIRFENSSNNTVLMKLTYSESN